MSWVECSECDEQFEYEWSTRTDVDVCPHCRSVDSLEEVEYDPPTTRDERVEL